MNVRCNIACFDKMEKALSLNYPLINGCPDFDGFDRIYFGQESCDRLLPSENELSVMTQKVRHNRKQFSFITPPTIDKGLNKIKSLLRLLDPEDEIIVNDLGVLKYVNDNYSHTYCTSVTPLCICKHCHIRSSGHYY